MTLEEQVEELKLIVSELRKSVSEKDRDEYEGLKRQLDDAIFQIDDIEEDFEKTLSVLKWSEFYAEIGEANLPTSDSYGFNFIDVVKREAENSLLQDLPGGEDSKNRFRRILSKIVDNPIADVLLNSSPVGAVITNIMNVASNFIGTSVTGGVLKKAHVATEDVISKERLDSFSSGLEKYVSFYDNLQLVTNNLLTKFNYISSKNSHLKTELHEYYSRYLSALGIDESRGEIIAQFNRELEVPVNSDGEQDYRAVLSKSNVMNAKKIALVSPAFRRQVDMFSKDLAQAVNEFIGDYIKVMEISLSWSDEDIDKNKVRMRVQKLKDFEEEHIRKSQLNVGRNVIKLASYEVKSRVA